MKKQKNATRIIAIVLVLLMALALIPFAASADGPKAPGESITWTYQGNGGAIPGTGETTHVQNLTAGQSFSLWPNEFVRAHYSFTGWHRTEPAVGQTEWADGEPVSDGSKYDSVLEAKWEQILVSVSFDGGAHGTGSMASDENLDAGSTYTVPTAWSGTSDTGWMFTDWKWNGNPVGTTIELPDTNVTLTAQWEMIDPVDIIFDPTGGTGGPGTVTTPRAVALTVPTTEPTWSGHNFLGWAESATATSPDYTVGGSTPIPTPPSGSSKTVYAVWEADAIPVTYNSGAGTVGTGTATNVDISDGNVLRSWSFDVKSIGELNIKEPSNKLFTYWSYNGKQYKAGDSYTVAASDTNIVFTANYADKCTVRYNSDGGTTYSPKTVVAGSVITLETPTKDKYTFMGWYTNAAKTIGPFEAGSEYTIEANTTFYAKWQSNYIPVTFNAGGGSGTMEDAEAPRDGEYTLPDNGFQPPLAEMAFVGWKIGATDVIKVPGEKVSTVGYGDTGLPLTAQWRDNAVTVTFDPNGGTATGGVKTQRMYRESASALSQFSTLSFTPPANKVFAGWSRTAAGDVQFADGESVQWNGANTGDKNYAAGDTVTLYAVWQDALSGTVALKKGTADVGTDTTFKTGEKLTGAATISAPNPAPSSIYYQVKRYIGADNVQILDSGVVTPSAGVVSVDHTVVTADFNNNIQFVFSSDPAFSNKIAGSANVKPDSEEFVTLTVTLEDAASGSTVKINGALPVEGKAQVLKGADVAVAITVDSTQQIKSVKKGGEEQTPVTLNYSWSFTADTPIAVAFETKGSTGNTMTLVCDTHADVSAAEAEFYKKIKDYAYGSFAVWEYVACWDNNVSKPLTAAQIEQHGGFEFKIMYPSKAGNIGDKVVADMTAVFNIKAWHYKNGSLTEVKTGTPTGVTVTPDKSRTGGVTLTGVKDFSEYGITLTPKALDGTVKLSGLVSDTTSGATAAVGKTLTASFTPSGPEVVGKLTYRWEYKDGTEWKLLATGESYTPTKSYRGWDLRCVATSDFETEPTTGWPNKAFKIIDKPNPEWHRDAVNNGGVQTGIVKNVTSDMMWSGPSSSKPGTTATWHTIAGTTFEVTKQGYYWVRFADDINCNNVSDAVYVANYFTVICHPNSVSGGRLYFEATTTGTSAEVHSDLKSHPDVVYDKYNSNHYWIREGGKGITVYAKTTNSKYYKITSITAYPTETSSFKKTGKADQLYVTIGSSYTYQPYEVVASAGVYGSKTGDTSHLELWVELAALSLMGLGAALVIARKKLKAQK